MVHSGAGHMYPPKNGPPLFGGVTGLGVEFCGVSFESCGGVSSAPEDDFCCY